MAVIPYRRFSKTVQYTVEITKTTRYLVFGERTTLSASIRDINFSAHPEKTSLHHFNFSDLPTFVNKYFLAGTLFKINSATDITECCQP